TVTVLCISIVSSSKNLLLAIADTQSPHKTRFMVNLSAIIIKGVLKLYCPQHLHNRESLHAF
ncbi:MAG: hypothetical protein ACE5Z5_14080, partial [Candidatus Bathyarchaeia archaeon]